MGPTDRVSSPPGPINAQKPRVPVHRAPMVPVAVAMVLGIVAGRYVPLATGFYAACGLAALGLAVFTFRREHLHLLTSIVVGVAVFAAGAIHVRITYFQVSEDHIVTYTGRSRIPATIRGQIVTSPQIVEADPNMTFGYRRPARTCFLLRADGIKTGDDWREVSGLVRVSVKEPDDRLAAGQDVELVGWMGRFRGPDNPGQFDQAAAARNQHTLVWMSVEGCDGVTVRPDDGASWCARAFWRLRALARQHWAGLGGEQEEQLLNALIIGERHPALQSLNRIMMRAGVVHFMSISGSHLVVFLGFVYLLCRLLALPPRRSAAAALIVLIAYMLLAEPNAPLLRSAIMAGALCLATIFRRGHATLNALAAATVILLVIDPLELFSAGFQLSFGMVAGLILLHRPVRDFLFGHWIRRRGLIVFREKARVRRWFYHTAADWLMSGLAVSLIAYVVSVPLVAYHFGLFSPYAAVLSLLLSPFITAVLVPGYVSLALAWPLPNLSHTVGRASAWASELLGRLVEAMRWLPGLSFELRPVGVWWALLCYVVIVLALLHRRLPRGRIWAGVAALVLAGATVYSQRAAAAPATAELHVLSVGAGQCVVLRTPSGRTFIIDAGSRSGLDVYEQVLRPFLRQRRLPGASIAVVSHANADHYSALSGLLAGGSVERVYLNGYFGRPAEGPDATEAAEFLAMCRRNGAELAHLRAGESLQLDDRTKMEVLWPPDGRADLASPRNVNDTSLVLRLTCDGTRVLLPGDVSELGQGGLLQPGQDLRADVLLMPHHGSWNDRLGRFFQAVAPKVAIASSDHDPRPPVNGKEAVKDFYTRLNSACRYYSTARNGWVCVRFGAGVLEVETMR